MMGSLSSIFSRRRVTLFYFFFTFFIIYFVLFDWTLIMNGSIFKPINYKISLPILKPCQANFLLSHAAPSSSTAWLFNQYHIGLSTGFFVPGPNFSSIDKNLTMYKRKNVSTKLFFAIMWLNRSHLRTPDKSFLVWLT